MGVKVEVVLDPTAACYTPGQDVTGWVKVTVQAMTPCTAIHARATGLCQVEWREDDSINNVRNSETYLDASLALWSGQDNDGNLMPGESTFPFRFKLPHKLPPSYEGTYGHIRYSVEAWNEVDKSAVRTPRQILAAVSNASAVFTVVSLLDLTADPKLTQALPLCKEESVCCWCCQGGVLMVSLTAEKGGYLAGESIHLSGEITNHTRKAVLEGTICLLQTTTFYGTFRTKEEARILKEVRRPGIDSGATDVWHAVQVPIPTSAVSLEHCTIITTEFKIKVSFLLGTFCRVDVENTVQLGALPVAREAFTPHQPPHYLSSFNPSMADPLQPQTPTQEQPQTPPASSDPLGGEAGEG